MNFPSRVLAVVLGVLALPAAAAAQTFVFPGETYDVAANQVGAGDFDGDGVSDFVALWEDDLVTLLRQPGGTLSPLPPQTACYGDHLEVADINRDGFPDVLIWTSSSFEFCVMRSNGDGTFVAEAPVDVGT